MPEPPALLTGAPRRTWDALVLAGAAEAALAVDAVGEATQDVRRGVPAQRLPVVLVWLCRGLPEGAQRGRALHFRVIATSAETAFLVHAVGSAPEHAILASRIPKVGHFRLVDEQAAACRSRRVARFARHRPVVRELAAEPALHVNAIGEAPDLAQPAVSVPIVRKMWWVGETARGRRADDLFIVALTTEAALGVLGTEDVVGGETARGRRADDLFIVALTTEAALGVLAVGQAAERGAVSAAHVPEVGHPGGVGEVAGRSGLQPSRLRKRNCYRQQHCESDPQQRHGGSGEVYMAR
eukprot:CAMPEP_0183487024 /NCGR_PEP_ID=MMETSP0370-20130417/180230_1 /TAXON_ID=268820 /ORGANISM="Peridinium aciculiferum, Strain PAER-2" /LENGTH=296 /DNA_ID=CAMNT_0025680345 /DNA_START=167 /DNA_END=1059 /DNA_ORIENTATION=+